MLFVQIFSIALQEAIGKQSQKEGKDVKF
ncbi:unknown protein [Waddlia chondrophila 2032/99]|uniref:Uncharacterized protein n=1 Tax=Waddlia chondrophila 2032/99 TaxID=765953 RepID=F8LFE0_9BACT|nr:unknown protein [Waddlia chondrophila 2032/99]